MSSRVVPIDPARIRARHHWFVRYSDVLVERLGGPVQVFRDGLHLSIPDTTRLPVERLYQNLLAAHLTALLLHHPLRFDDALARIREAGWLRGDLSILVELFADLVASEEVGSKGDFLRTTINLLAWRMSVRVAAQVPLERICEELVNVWGMEEIETFLEEVIASAALPAPPQLPRDDVQAHIDFLATDDGFQRVRDRQLAEYDEHAWTHPDLPHVIRPWLNASLIQAINDAGVPGFGDDRVLARCAETRQAIGEWMKGCTAAEALLLMPSTQLAE